MNGKQMAAAAQLVQTDKMNEATTAQRAGKTNKYADVVVPQSRLMYRDEVLLSRAPRP